MGDHPGQGQASSGARAGPPGSGHQSIPDGTKRKGLFRVSIRAKLVLLLLIAVLPIGAVVIRSGLKLQEEAADVHQETFWLVRNFTEAHERAVASTKQLLTVLSKMSEVRSPNGPACKALFAELLRQNQLYTDIIATDARGRSFASGSGRVGVDLGDRKYFLDARRTRAFSAGEYVVGRTSNVPMLAFACPILSAGGRFKGVVTAGMNLDRYGALFSMGRLSQDAALTITDGRGIVLFRSGGTEDRRGKSDAPGLIRQMLAGDAEGIVRANRPADGDRRIIGYKRFQLKEGAPPYLFIRVSFSAEKALAKARRDLLISLALLGVAFIIALASALFIGNKVIGERLKRLMKASEDLGRGDLGVRTGLPHKEDELGSLARAFDVMAEGLEEKEWERKRAEEALRESEEAAIHLSQESMAMARIGQIIGSTLNIDDIYEQFAGEVAALIAFDRISIGIIDHAKALVTITYASGIPMPGRKKGDAFPLAGTMAERVALTRSGVLVSAEDREEVRALLPSVLLLKESDKDTWSIIVVPLIAQDKVIGALHISSLKAGAYSKRDLSLAERIAAQIAGAIANAQLFNEVKEAEARLRESEEKYRDIFDNSIEGIYVSTPEGRPISINPALAHMHGYASPEEMQEEITRVDTQLYVNAEDRVRYLRLLGEHGEVRAFETEQHRKDGSTYWASISARAVKNGRGEVVRCEATVEDITERKRLEGELRQAQKMEAIGQLAGGVAHDFNNLLMALMGYANLLQMKMGQNDPLRVYVDQILASTAKAANITQSLLAFGRKQVMEMKPHKITAMVMDVEKLLERLMPEDIELTIKLGDDTIVMADMTQIDQLLINLATNARDAMPQGGKLKIETQRVELGEEFRRRYGYGKPGFYALLSVSDTGIGMDEKTQQKIFEPFFTTKELGKGTGLGLSIVYGIIKQHNGYINVSSRPGEGSTFLLYLPEVKEKPRETRTAVGRAKGGSETLLLGEDNADVRAVTSDILKMSGYTVIEAVNGGDAVEKFRGHQGEVKLIILDVVMPEKNGKEAYEEMRTMRHDIKVLFMSGYTGDVVLDKGVFSKALDYIAKPIAPNDLLRKVRNILDR